MDFKENLRISGGSTETKKEYFGKKQISVLGFAIITIKKIKKHQLFYLFF